MQDAITIKEIAVMNHWLETVNVMMATKFPYVGLMEVIAALMSWLETDFVMMSTISKIVVTMMEVIVDHQISQIGQNVPIILH